MADTDGGFGTAAEVEPSAGEQQLTEMDVTPQGVIHPEPTLEPEGDAGEQDWTAAIQDPTLREKVQQKGYRSPEDLAKAYTEAESKLGQGSGEVAELRRMLEEQAQEISALRSGPMLEPPQVQQQLPDWGQMTLYARQVAQAIQAGDVDVEAGLADLISVQADLAAAREQHLMETLRNEFREEVGYATQPLNDFTRQANYNQQITAARREYGEDLYRQLAPRAGELLQQWGSAGEDGKRFIKNPTSIRVALAEAFKELTLSERRAAEAETLNGSGPGPSGREVDPAALVVESIRNAGGGPSSGGFA